MIGRRRFLIGAGAILAAPAIVRAASLMPVASLRYNTITPGFGLAALKTEGGAADFDTSDLLVKATERWYGVFVDKRFAEIYGGPSGWFPGETYFGLTNHPRT